MSDTRVEAAYAGALAAFKNPMLDLLHGRFAPFVVAVLSVTFTSERAAVPVADAHAEIGDMLDQLRAAGYAEGEAGEVLLPVGTARDVCRQWVRAGWLLRQIEGVEEVYRLSAHAVGALEVAGRASGSRARVSESRVRTLLETVERLALDADPDVLTRVARLTEEIAQRRAEIARLDRTGVVDTVDDDTLLEQAENILHLTRELPADFARVVESIRAMQRDVVTDLRQDVRPAGEVLREYLQRGKDVMAATPEGKAFAGALRMIGDPRRLDDLATNLRTVLRHRFTRQMSPPERAELAAVGRRIEAGVAEVLAAQQTASHVITTQVRTHDPARDRQVDDLLRDVMSGFQAWMPDSRASDVVDPLRRLPNANLAHLRQSLSELRPPEPPEALTQRGDLTGAVEDTRAWGGPSYRALEAHLDAYAAARATTDDDSFDVAEVFEAAPEEIRRPVDLLGLLEIAHRLGMSETGEISTVEAVRADGVRRSFAFGAVTAPMKASMTNENDEDDDD